MDFVVIGGGCYGCFHTRQLRRAQQAGRVPASRILVIDRHADCRASREFAGDPRVRVVQADWLTFLGDYLEGQPPDSDAQVVPACWAPHLFFDWLAASLRRALPGRFAATSRQPFDSRLPCTGTAVGLPYEQTDAAGNRFLSEAGWRCPSSCIEPAVCPAVKRPRDWDLAQRISGAARASPSTSSEQGLGVDLAEVFLCRHYAYGVGAIPVAELLAARDRLLAAARANGSLRAAIATSSHCHGVVAVLQVERASVAHVEAHSSPSATA